VTPTRITVPGIGATSRAGTVERVAVAAGERVAELDNTQFTSELEEKRLTAAQKADDLSRSEAAAAAAAEAAEREAAGPGEVSAAE